MANADVARAFKSLKTDDVKELAKLVPEKVSVNQKVFHRSNTSITKLT